jgi:hypothetical protein
VAAQNYPSFRSKIPFILQVDIERAAPNIKPSSPKHDCMVHAPSHLGGTPVFKCGGQFSLVRFRILTNRLNRNRIWTTMINQHPVKKILLGQCHHFQPSPAAAMEYLKMAPIRGYGLGQVPIVAQPVDIFIVVPPGMVPRVTELPD